MSPVYFVPLTYRFVVLGEVTLRSDVVEGRGAISVVPVVPEFAGCGVGLYRDP